jgi:uncharacterized protein
MPFMSNRRRMQVYRTTHLLHWISAAVCLAGLLLFSITGITLNHSGAISANPTVTKRTAQVPEPLRSSLAGEHAAADAVPAPLTDWISNEFGVATDSATVEWSADELYLSAPGPGRDAWVSIERADGAARFESTDRGWIAYFNDLHKGRNTGVVWIIFIDVIAAACLFFSLTGLVLLQIQARQRPSTWPLVLGGVGLVVAVMIFFVH